jgi:hypothetical protein
MMPLVSPYFHDLLPKFSEHTSAEADLHRYTRPYVARPTTGGGLLRTPPSARVRGKRRSERGGALTVVALAEGFDEHFDLRVVGRIVRGRLDSRHVQTRPAGDDERTLQGRSDDLVHLRRVDYVPPALNAGSRHGNPIQVALHALAREGVCISSPAGHHIR